jgi:hypothetical protein
MNEQKLDFLQDQMSNLVLDLALRINKEKERLIQERISILICSDFNIYEDAKKRFPRIKVVYDKSNNSEHYYWNDGSENGQLLISFFPDNIGNVECSSIMIASLKYR